MKGLRWKWFLPLAQLVLASAALVYGPHEYHARVVLDRISGDNNTVEYFSQNYPSPVERLSKGINFPALVLAYPFKAKDNPIYVRESEYTVIWISPKEIAFFIGIAMFWYWLGDKLDQRGERSSGRRSIRKVDIAEFAIGIAFAILAGAYAIQMIADKWIPFKQIGVFGIAWSLGLFVYFVWCLKQESRSVSKEELGGVSLERQP